MKRKETAYVIAQEQISAGIYSLRLSVSFARDVRAGQFVSLFSADRSRLLPRAGSAWSTVWRERERRSFPV